MKANVDTILIGVGPMEEGKAGEAAADAALDYLAVGEVGYEGLAGNLDDLYLNVISARRVSKSIPVSGMPVPRCPHCGYLTEGIYFYPEVLKYGKNSH